ncbi:MAG: hypothetical protein C4520_19600 [Candidatus Abyssobacteria bacterium SURF_5]|uniref:Uncharacterized protein n=1 Tax=Abyssobacteria bacterium (strain SURF_5) TaxID=2093360 RepID=A0A3A4NKL5_ABYX5|nr:MAG: hypothetical protein C4520_19600 [Candidatus Abyssubacteria bacterium SURF_5]
MFHYQAAGINYPPDSTEERPDVIEFPLQVEEKASVIHWQRSDACNAARKAGTFASSSQEAI